MLKNFFTKNQKITLSKALELKETLQEKLKSNQNILKLENSVYKGQKRNYNLKKIVKDSEVLQDQLVRLKVLIQKANLQLIEGETTCVSDNVYELSEKSVMVRNLQAILKETHEGTTKDEKSGKMVTFDKPVYSRPELEDWINKLKKDCKAHEDKLTLLNNSIIVELPFKTNLI